MAYNWSPVIIEWTEWHKNIFHPKAYRIDVAHAMMMMMMMGNTRVANNFYAFVTYTYISLIELSHFFKWHLCQLVVLSLLTLPSSLTITNGSGACAKGNNKWPLNMQFIKTYYTISTTIKYQNALQNSKPIFPPFTANRHHFEQI